VNEQLRRRSVGAPAARSVLLTILGEYVLPRRDAVWQETLVASLEAMGYTAQAARQALARSSREGWLVGERHGRRRRLALSPATASLLQSGAERIYSFGENGDWSGDWLVVVLRVPEAQREVRDQLRTRLAWAGLGSLGGGVWVTPRVEREQEIADVVRAAGSADVWSFRGELSMLGDQAGVISAGWDLGAVRGAYDEFLAQFGNRTATTPRAGFSAQTSLVHAWRRFPFMDPDLPADLLPARWPRARAHAVFQDRHARWAPLANEHFQSLEDSVASPVGPMITA